MFDNNIIGSIKTSGVFLLYQNKFAFMVGPDKSGDKLCAVRFGGHIEGDESPVECAVREVLEEASVHIRLISSPITYYKRSWGDENYTTLEASIFEIKPIVVTGDKTRATALFLAYAENQLIPAAETHGIILLGAQEIDWICNARMSLSDFISKGGKLIQRKEMDHTAELIAGPHVRFLYDLIKENNEVIQKFVKHEY